MTRLFKGLTGLKDLFIKLGIKITILCLASEILFLLSVSQAKAEGFSVYDYGARGSSLGGAMLARKPDPSAIAHNPALLTKLPGTWVMAGATAIGTAGKIDHPAGRTAISGSIYTLPHAYFTHQLSDRLFLGVGEFSRFGLGNEYPADWPGRFNIYEVYLMSASLNPVLAFKATKKLSLAVGVELLYAALSMKSKVNFLPMAEIDSRIEEAKDLAVGFNLAGHYQFNPQWAVGIQYRSPIRLKAKGQVDFTYLGPNLPSLIDYFNSNFVDGTVKGVVTLPESIAAGVSYSPTEKISLEIGAVWTRWSRFKELALDFPGSLQLVSPKKWKDTWRVTTGLEWAALDWLDVRVGYNWTESPMTTPNADYTVPTRNRHTYTIGLGFHNERFSLDLAYIYVYCRSRGFNDSPVGAGGNGTLASKSQKFLAHEGAISLTYHF
ncbi:MAG: outer membrane protein transport protein [Deltaproteobacteria bacterium]|jgi:long-chain fatty acid transport protein|nr:outer membrane protein transport protein [Deltaproteobacteria bacterium]